MPWSQLRTLKAELTGQAGQSGPERLTASIFQFVSVDDDGGRGFTDSLWQRGCVSVDTRQRPTTGNRRAFEPGCPADAADSPTAY